MGAGKTEAWVLRRSSKRERETGTLERDFIDLPDMTEVDVLVEPIYGCWEANMTHALERDPVDICLYRREPQVVLGNSAVVRILAKGAAVTRCNVGDICISMPSVEKDRYGHTLKVLAYDGRRTIGSLAKRTVWHQDLVAPLVLKDEHLAKIEGKGNFVAGQMTRHCYKRWAGFPVRYTTAWDNWQLTYRIWQAQFKGQEPPTTHVWGWGGGVSFAELQLAKLNGCRVAMTASTDRRLAQLEEHGITAVDRRKFPDLEFDCERNDQDRDYRSRHHGSEKGFLELVKQLTGDDGVSIFIDNLGTPLYQTVLRALGRYGVITTAGWRSGAGITYWRPNVCISRQIFVHTHGCQAEDGLRAAIFAELNNWLPPAGAEEYSWDDVPKLAADFSAGKLESYYPIYRVNPL